MASANLAVDTKAPTVTNVTSTKNNGTYGIDTVITVTVAFTENVTVTGTPQITLETGGSDAVVNVTGGSGTSTLSFAYTVASGHTASDLDYTATTSLALNSGTIKDVFGNPATLTLASPGGAGSLGNNKAIVIDGTAPVISSTAPAQDAYVKTTQVSYTFSETVVSGTITWTRTGGTVDPGSPHAQALTGGELSSGAHSSITLSNAPTLVNGAVYTISFNAIDAGGNPAAPVSNTNVMYDVSAPITVITSPANDTCVNAQAAITGTATDGSGSGVAGVVISIQTNPPAGLWWGGRSVQRGKRVLAWRHGHSKLVIQFSRRELGQCHNI
jgi:hypothetical protein